MGMLLICQLERTKLDGAVAGVQNEHHLPLSVAE